jgi:hypothetical protein
MYPQTSTQFNSILSLREFVEKLASFHISKKYLNFPSPEGNFFFLPFLRQ